ncbi:GAF domain-containing protein [Pleionea sediminis]|uniref:GAF domain-containing protein n=1 Tax=Pleionea sediminis TaxID=2569479 RepID=UPI0011870829|nr:GAF domain-containing protein [Pleionea sediminis]
MDNILKNVASLSRQVDSSKDTNELCHHACQTIIDGLQLDDNVIYLRNADNRFMQFVAHGNKHCENTGVLSPLSLSEGEGVVGAAAQTASNLIISDTSQTQNYIVDDQQRLSEIAVPIRYQGQVIGVIDSEHPEAHFFKQEHEWFMESVSAIIAPRIAAFIDKKHHNLSAGQSVQLSTSDEEHHVENLPRQHIQKKEFLNQMDTIIKNFHQSDRWDTQFLKDCLLLETTNHSILTKIDVLRQEVSEVVDEMAQHSKTQLWARLLNQRYLLEKKSQLQLADEFNMAFSTFRRHQSLAKNHLVAQLWLREECRQTKHR